MFFSGPATKRDWPLRKRTSFEARKKIPKNVATKLDGGGWGKALVAGH